MIALLSILVALALMLYVWGIVALANAVQDRLLFRPGEVAIPVILTLLLLFIIPGAILIQLTL